MQKTTHLKELEVSYKVNKKILNKLVIIIQIIKEKEKSMH